MPLVQVTGKDLTELWFNFLVHLATHDSTFFYSPSVHAKKVYGETTGIHLDESIMEKDFYRYSGYTRDTKVQSLRTTYFNRRVEKQYDLLLENVRNLQPRQARGMITFSEPAFNKTDRMRCLDSLFIQKTTMTKYEATIVFRNTEVWPKTYMDFVFLYELLEGLIPQKVICESFCAFIPSTFVNVHQAPTAAMMMRRYGITAWNKPFKDSLIKWQEKFADPAIVDTLTMQWIKRVVSRTHRLMEEDGVDIGMLINGD
jgi:hypothetical protein